MNKNRNKLFLGSLSRILFCLVLSISLTSCANESNKQRLDSNEVNRGSINYAMGYAMGAYADPSPEPSYCPVDSIHLNLDDSAGSY